MLRSLSQTVGRTVRAVIIANRYREFKSKPAKLRFAFGNRDDKLSLSKIIYSTQLACKERHQKWPQYNVWKKHQGFKEIPVYKARKEIESDLYLDKWHVLSLSNINSHIAKQWNHNKFFAMLFLHGNYGSNKTGEGDL